MSEARRAYIDAMVEIIIRCYDDGVKIEAFAINYDTGNISITVGE